MDDKLAVLLAADAAMRSVKGIAVAEGSFECQRIRKTFASTEGSYVEQTLVETGGGIEALAVDDHDAQRRSYPNSFGRHHGTAGYEHFTALDFASIADGDCAAAPIAVSGADVSDDVVAVTPPATVPATVIAAATVQSATQLSVTVCNFSGGPVEPDGSYRWVAIQL